MRWNIREPSVEIYHIHARYMATYLQAWQAFTKQKMKQPKNQIDNLLPCNMTLH